MGNQKQKILIVDDSEMNRDLLVDMLGDEYEVVEAENGLQAVAILQQRAAEFTLLLLDIMMPEMDGFEVLAYMNKYHWNENIAVIMISADNTPTYIKHAYDLGAFDYISRPFDPTVVHQRVSNTLMAYAKQRQLANIVAEKIYEQEKSNKLMISILSHIVEFRNGESGLHVLHINTITELLLKHLVQKTDQYPLTKADITLISNASSLHDIGKISIPSEILNKPGRFTEEEFQIMKGHSMAGADMLHNLPYTQQEDPLVKTAYEICRWHHERYDGGGYPDGLKGDEIPISAQIVALADVYDALTSERCYKKAHPHKQAIEMILGGQCGTFNPLLMECLREIESTLEREMKATALIGYDDSKNIQNISEQLHDYKLFSSERTLNLLSYEQQRVQFLTEMSNDIIFSYNDSPAVLTLNKYGAKRLGLEECIVEPMRNDAFLACFGKNNIEKLLNKVEKAKQDMPYIRLDIKIPEDAEEDFVWYQCWCKAIWASDTDEKCTGVVGKLIEVDERQLSASKEGMLNNALKKSNHFGTEFPYYTFTAKEVWHAFQYLEMVFDTVRLVDVVNHRQVSFNSEGHKTALPYQCYSIWDKNKPCQNCVSAKALETKGKFSKFEFIDDKTYHILAMYVEVDNEPYSLEMVTKTVDETLIEGSNRQLSFLLMSDYSNQLYVDALTNTYNRRYYEEQLKDLEIQAIAVIDADSFKYINDHYGHQVGDIALKKIAKALTSCVRKTDAIVRYGGDEFAVVFPQIPEEAFGKRLESMRDAVYQLVMEDYPEIHLSVSIGGVYGKGKTTDLFPKADTLMYQAKQIKNKVVITSEGNDA